MTMDTAGSITVANIVNGVYRVYMIHYMDGYLPHMLDDGSIVMASSPDIKLSYFDDSRGESGSAHLSSYRNRSDEPVIDGFSDDNYNRLVKVIEDYCEKPIEVVSYGNFSYV